MGGLRALIESDPTTLADMMIPPTSLLLFSLLKNKLSDRNTEWVILVILVTFRTALNKLLGRRNEAVGWLSVVSNDKSLGSISSLISRTEKFPRLALNIRSFIVVSSRSICCTETANVFLVMTRGSEMFSTGISSAIDSIASRILLLTN